VFLGTADFAVPSLRGSAAEHDVLAVVTQPDKPGNRGRPAPRPIADAARELGLPVLTPRRIRAPEAVAEIAALQPDVLVVAAYGQILPQSLLDVPRLGAVNVHASLLPRWRGASPVAHAILAGDTDTGVSIMQMDAGLDTGAVYRQQAVAIPPDATTPSLTATLAQIGASLLGEVLVQLERGDAAAVPQPDDGVTLAPRLAREDGEVHWEQSSAAEVDRRVRALQPWPGVTASLDGAPVRVLAGSADPGQDRRAADAHPGSIIDLDGESAVIATRAGAYRVERVLPPGSRAMSAAAFLRGRRPRG
jgi:methionyl-tRNA formyltransferase